MMLNLLSIYCLNSSKDHSLKCAVFLGGPSWPFCNRFLSGVDRTINFGSDFSIKSNKAVLTFLMATMQEQALYQEPNADNIQDFM